MYQCSSSQMYQCSSCYSYLVYIRGLFVHLIWEYVMFSHVNRFRQSSDLPVRELQTVIVRQCRALPQTMIRNIIEHMPSYQLRNTFEVIVSRCRECINVGRHTFAEVYALIIINRGRGRCEEIFVLTFNAYGRKAVRSMRLERQNKYF